MARTIAGQPRLEIKRKADARKGRELIRKNREFNNKRDRDFESLREDGNKPSLKLGPLNLRKRT